MYLLKKKYMIIVLLLSYFCISCMSEEKKSPLSLSWRMELLDIQEVRQNKQYFVVKNISNDTVYNGWSIFFTQFPYKECQQVIGDELKIEIVSGTYHRIHPTDKYKSIAPGDSVVIILNGRGEKPGFSMQPEGAYFICNNINKDKPLPVELIKYPLPLITDFKKEASIIYENNKKILEAKKNIKRRLNIIPSVKEISLGNDSLYIYSDVKILSHADFKNESLLLQKKLEKLYCIKNSDKSEVYIELKYLPFNNKINNNEYYEINIKSGKVTISAMYPHGIFNGIQTFLSMLKGQEFPYKLSELRIKDYPDLLYRGHMIDIARNFISVEETKKIIDIISSYKMNVLRIHFCDDEGWRLQIPGIEELTEIASHRGHTVDESKSLYPAYDGCYNYESNSSGNGYYSRKEFIDLIRYAAKRYVTIIPEIESPGHARAAIIAMKSRYNKYIESDYKKACEYLLSEKTDTSRYVSAQGYNDNVMNVGMKSTYNFMYKVIDEIISMYNEAGVPLKYIHIGGDEVPEGCWSGSISCEKLMLENGLNNSHCLSNYFTHNIASYLEKNNIKFGVWQESAVFPDKKLENMIKKTSYGISCWKTSSNNDSDEIVYEYANKGYPVIISSVTNLYFDMSYSAHPDEIGHNWSEYVDEVKAFSLLPFDIYRSYRNKNLYEKVNDRDVLLSEKGSKNIIGIESTSWGETIRNNKNLEYMLFPKIMGTSERGWNSYPLWHNLTGIERQKMFEKELAVFYNIISDNEISYWNKLNIDYRLPYPGIIINNDTLYMNTIIDGGKIFYTTDGSEPTYNSLEWISPIKIQTDIIKAKLFLGPKKSLTLTVKK